MAVSEGEARKSTSHGWRSPLSTPIERNENSTQDLFQHLEKLIASTVSICRLKGSLECQTGGLITVAEELQRLVRFAVSEISRVERDLKRHKANCEEEISCLKDQVNSLMEERDALKKQVDQSNQNNSESSCSAENRFYLEGSSCSSHNVTENVVEGDINLFNHLQCVLEDVQSSKRFLQRREKPKISNKMYNTEKTKTLKKKAAGKRDFPRKNSASNLMCDAQHDEQSSENTEDLLDLMEQDTENDHYELWKSKRTPEMCRMRIKGNKTEKPLEINVHDVKKSNHAENTPSLGMVDEDISNIEQDSKEDEKTQGIKIPKKKNKKESKAGVDELKGKKKRSVRKIISSANKSIKEKVPSQKQVINSDCDGFDNNDNNKDGTSDGNDVGNGDGCNGNDGARDDGGNVNDGAVDVDNGNDGAGDDDDNSNDGSGDDDDNSNDGAGDDDDNVNDGTGDDKNGISDDCNGGDCDDDGNDYGLNVETTPKTKCNDNSKLMLPKRNTKSTPKDDDEPLGDLSFLIDVSSRISDFVNSNNKELELPPMTSRQRSDVYKLTKLYNVRGRFGSKTDNGTSMVLVKGAQTQQPRAGKVDALLSELSIAARKETTPKAKRKRNMASNVEENDTHRRTTEEDEEGFEEIEIDMRIRKKRKPRH